MCCWQVLVIFRQVEEPSVLGGSTGPGQKARAFLTKQESFPTDQNNLSYHPGPVLPPGGDGS